MPGIEQTADLEIVPSSWPCGAEVWGLDLSLAPPDAVAERLNRALADHNVLLFPDQALTERGQVRFTRAFGETCHHPLGEIAGRPPRPDPEPDPHVYYICDIPGEEYKGKQERQGGLGWHTDLYYMPEPQVYSLLYAMEVPKGGGETSFLSLEQAYRALDDGTRRTIDDLEVVIWFSRKIEPVTHPLVRIHPVTGNRCLFFSPGLVRRVVGWDEGESQELIDRLTAHVSDPVRAWSHRWREGDVLMWDNRHTLHSRGTFDLSQRRVMRRTQTVGEKVLRAGGAEPAPHLLA